jgi:HEAT repeat protein
MGDAEAHVRGTVYAALGELGDRRALEPLRQILSPLNRDDPFNNKRLAAEAIQKIEARGGR